MTSNSSPPDSLFDVNQTLHALEMPVLSKDRNLHPIAMRDWIASMKGSFGRVYLWAKRRLGIHVFVYPP